MKPKILDSLYCNIYFIMEIMEIYMQYLQSIPVDKWIDQALGISTMIVKKE